MAASIDDVLRLATVIAEAEDAWRQRFRDKCPEALGFYEQAELDMRELGMAYSRASIGNMREVMEASSYLANKAPAVFHQWAVAREMVRLFRERDFPPVTVVMQREDDDGR